MLIMHPKVKQVDAYMKRLYFFPYGGVFKKTLWGAKYFSVSQAIFEILECLPEEYITEGVRKLSPPGKDLCFIPVPLHFRKQRERGFNQAEVIAQVLSKKTGIPLYGNVVTRHVSTLQQARLNRNERLKNMVNTFKCKDVGTIVGKTVIIVDDVWTTGATVKAVADAIHKKGIRSTHALTLAG